MSSAGAPANMNLVSVRDTDGDGKAQREDVEAVDDDTAADPVSKALSDSGQHLRDIKLAFEYRLLMSSAPGGIYILPEMDDIR